jgi:hypothetical protein
MSGTGARLTLVIPALAGGLRDVAPVPRLPALERMVARGTRQPLPDHSFAHHLTTLFGLESGGELPLGPLCRLGEGAAPDDGWWFCAAPVHFFAARDHLRLASVEELRPEEGEALVALFNRHFGADGWRLEAASSAHWYLRAPAPQALRTRSLREASQSDLRSALPEGPDALGCHRFLNEVQMLFHGGDVNAAREARGLLAVNGLWFWGGGEMPMLPRRFAQVWSEMPLVRGLAAASGAGAGMLPETLPALVGNALAVIDPERSQLAWNAAEEGWFAAAERGLRDGSLAEVIIDSGTGYTVRVTRRDLRRWWRLRRALGPDA